MRPMRVSFGADNKSSYRTKYTGFFPFVIRSLLIILKKSFIIVVCFLTHQAHHSGYNS